MIHRVATLVLSSSIMGLLLAPLVYIGIGSLSGFAVAFSLISLPLLLPSCAFLLYSYLRRPANLNAPRRWLPVAESITWLVVALFLVLVSGFTLLTTTERIGLFFTLALAASLTAAPCMAFRPTSLAARISQWPVSWVVASAGACAMALVGGTVAYLLTPSRFL
jgi:hypothetical protein